MDRKSTAHSDPSSPRPTRFAVLLVGSLLLAMSALLTAAESAGDCTEIDLTYEVLDGALTDREIAERRERRHAASLNAFERCAAKQSGSGQGDGQGGGGQGGGNGVAAGGIAGTNTVVSEVEPPPLTTATATEAADPASEPTSEQTNGRAPLDIPAADNDSVLAAQIRRAAETETNPERQARLWNEYRKIKGLPTQES